MTEDDILRGRVVDDMPLTLEELACACAVATDWIIERVDADLLACYGSETGEMRFASTELVRARRLLMLERNFDADPELAALTVDLIEEVERLRRQLAMSGVLGARF